MKLSFIELLNTKEKLMKILQYHSRFYFIEKFDIETKTLIFK